MNLQTSDFLGAIFYAVMPWIIVIGQLPWIGIMIQVIVALLASLIIHRFGTDVLQRLTAPFPYSRRLVLYGNRVGLLVVFLLLTQIVLRGAPDKLAGIEILRHLNALGLIAAVTWLGVRCVGAIADTIIERNPVHAADNLQARRIQTQTRVLARVVMGLIFVIGSGIALMTLPLFRQIGTSLLASAGVASLVVGFAAKPVLGNLLAGMQLALTQPIRLEDVVIVENEWGWVEEITSTYVVVRIWDQRRMIVPLQWFIEHPFQNWTRTNSEILGTILVWVDYRLPLEPLRKEAQRICENSPDWDGRLCLTQVVEAGERAMQLRVLVSAGDSTKSWDLRCRVREGLVDFIQENYPDCLPRMRAEVEDKASEMTNRSDRYSPE
jgi:small-conductance mechanosensitive channel